MQHGERRSAASPGRRLTQCGAAAALQASVDLSARAMDGSLPPNAALQTWSEPSILSHSAPHLSAGCTAWARRIAGPASQGAVAVVSEGVVVKRGQQSLSTCTMGRQLASPPPLPLGCPPPLPLLHGHCRRQQPSSSPFKPRPSHPQPTMNSQLLRMATGLGELANTSLRAGEASMKQDSTLHAARMPTCQCQYTAGHTCRHCQRHVLAPRHGSQQTWRHQQASQRAWRHQSAAQPSHVNHVSWSS